MNDDYRELLEDARDALHKLLTNSEPGTGFDLHHAYASITEALAERPAAPAKRPTAEPCTEPWHGRTWGDEPLRNRERDVLAVLSEHRYSVSELRLHLDETQARYDDGRRYVYDGEVRNVVTRLFKADELDRVSAPVGNRVRYRYFRRTELQGPIAELDRAFHTDDETGA